MKRSRAIAAADLRGFRWALQAVERRTESALESARLALRKLQAEADAVQAKALRQQELLAHQEGLACECVRRDPRLGPHVLAYLGTLHAARAACDASGAELQQRVQAARAACLDRQRQLESVQSLRAQAEDRHAQAQRRREWNEADGAWMALLQQRRSAGPRTPERSE